MYIVLKTEVLFRPCLTDCYKKAEVVISSSWVHLDYVVVAVIIVVVIHVYLQKQTGTITLRNRFDILQETSECYNPNDKYEYFVTAHIVHSNQPKSQM